MKVEEVMVDFEEEEVTLVENMVAKAEAKVVVGSEVEAKAAVVKEEVY